jgi:DNA-binding NarL/FixJ family response regulator
VREPSPIEDTLGSVLIVDDDPAFRELVSILCQRAGYRCREAQTSEEVLETAARERPDVVLLDVKLGDASGYQICRDLREQFGEKLHIIFLSGERTDPSDRVAGLLLGADDYITKPFDAEELVARVARAVARSASSAEDTPVDEGSRLTPREREVLSLLAHGFGTQAISDRLYISPKTVSTHVQRMLAKLDLHSRGEAVAFAYRMGLVDDVSAHSLEGDDVLMPAEDVPLAADSADELTVPA